MMEEMNAHCAWNLTQLPTSTFSRVHVDTSCVLGVFTLCEKTQRLVRVCYALLQNSHALLCVAPKQPCFAMPCSKTAMHYYALLPNSWTCEAVEANRLSACVPEEPANT